MKKKDRNGSEKKIIRITISWKLIIAAVIVIAMCVGGGFGLKTILTQDETATKLGFENIGELATQEADTTNVKVIDKSQNIYGIEIPFTQSKTVFSYDMVIKAGIDFSEVKVISDEQTKKVTVTIPKVKVLDNDVQMDSLKVYDETNGLFTNITLKDTSDGIEQMKKDAEKTAIANGLLDKAETNAETLIKNMLSTVYNWDKYSIVYKTK